MEKLRTRRMLAYVKAKKFCTVAELMERFGASSATVHRDIAELAKRDAVERVRGGIVFNDAPDAKLNPSEYQERVVANRRAKAVLARRAMDLVHEGDIVFLDSSTTVYELALLLKDADFDHLTVVTNAMAVMGLFRKFPQHWNLIGLGGSYDASLNACLGAVAVGQLADFNMTKAFVSAFGLDDGGATTNSERLADMLRRVLALSERRYLVVDRSKLGRTGLFRIGAREMFDGILTEGDC